MRTGISIGNILYPVFLTHLAYKEIVILFGNDTIVHTYHHNTFHTMRADKAVACVGKADIIAYCNIPVDILLQIVMK